MSYNTKGRTSIEVGADGVALMTIINPPVNSLSLDVLNSLKDSYEQALRRDDVKAIVVTGARGKFSGGFDITAFGSMKEGNIPAPKPGYVSVEILSNTVEGARKPSVAAIDGLALGGGLEVAMACHARISTPNAQLGLPELQLGVIPGFGVKAADLDIAAVMGMGFPPYRGGILFWADSLGSKYLYSRLDEWSKMYGEFFKPCAYLTERAANGTPLSSPMEQAKSRL